MWRGRTAGLNHARGGARVLALDAYEAREALGRPQGCSSQLWRRGRDISGRYVGSVTRVAYLVMQRTRDPIYGHAIWHNVGFWIAGGGNLSPKGGLYPQKQCHL